MSMDHDFEPDYEPEVEQVSFDDSELRDEPSFDDSDRYDDTDSEDDGLDSHSDTSSAVEGSSVTQTPSRSSAAASETGGYSEKIKRADDSHLRDSTKIRDSINQIADMKGAVPETPLAKRVRESLDGRVDDPLSSDKTDMAVMIASVVAELLSRGTHVQSDPVSDGEEPPAEAAVVAPVKKVEIKAAAGAPDLKDVERNARKRVEKHEEFVSAPQKAAVPEVVVTVADIDHDVTISDVDVEDGVPEPVVVSEPTAPPVMPVARRVTAPSVGGLVRRNLDDSEETKISRFPKDIMTLLRERLAQALGENVGSDKTADAKGNTGLSNKTLLVGFVCSVFGDEYELDEQTQMVADAFARSDLRLNHIDGKLNDVMETLEGVQRDARLANNAARAAFESAYSSELGLSFLVADRVVGLPDLTHNQTLSSFDTSDTRVVEARENHRRRAKALMNVERDRVGRDIKRS